MAMFAHTSHGSARFWCVLIAAGLGLLVSAGCSRTINRAAERRIRDILPEVVGPARSWRAFVRSSPINTVRGRLGDVDIEGEDVELAGIVRCARLRLHLRQVAVDTLQGEVESIAATHFEAVVDEAAVNDYLKASPPPADEPVRIESVRLLDGRIYARGTRWLLGRAWPFTTSVEPELVNGTRLLFDPLRISIVGVRVPLPASWLSWLARRLSDGFDFRELPFPVRIRRFEVRRGQLLIQGTADVAEILRRSRELSRGPLLPASGSERPMPNMLAE
jgi:hypothetical protein